MLFTVLVPEYIIGRALNELLSAKEQDLVFGQKIIYTYMVNMGYFVIDFGDYWLEGKAHETGGRVEEDFARRTAFSSRPAEPDYSLQKVCCRNFGRHTNLKSIYEPEPV